MNERIKELESQCWVPMQYGPAWFNGTKFAELIVRDCANQLVQANMSNPAYAQAMDEYYEQKWAHRFD